VLPTKAAIKRWIASAYVVFWHNPDAPHPLHVGLQSGALSTGSLIMPSIRNKEDALQCKLEQIGKMGAAELRVLWQSRKSTTAPSFATARLMRAAIAWDMQAEILGGKPPLVRRRWEKVERARTHGATALAYAFMDWRHAWHTNLNGHFEPAQPIVPEGCSIGDRYFWPSVSQEKGLGDIV
jgi:hypothetical protein